MEAGTRMSKAPSLIDVKTNILRTLWKLGLECQKSPLANCCKNQTFLIRQYVYIVIT